METYLIYEEWNIKMSSPLSVIRFIKNPQYCPHLSLTNSFSLTTFSGKQHANIYLLRYLTVERTSEMKLTFKLGKLSHVHSDFIIVLYK
jgi:hypothetical protein